MNDLSQTLRSLFALKPFIPRSPSLSEDCHISKEEHSFYSSPKPLTSKNFLANLKTPTNPDQIRISQKRFEKVESQIWRNIELYSEGNIAEELAQKILRIDSLAHLKKMLTDFCLQKVSSPKFAKTMAKTLHLVLRGLRDPKVTRIRDKHNKKIKNRGGHHPNKNEGFQNSNNTSMKGDSHSKTEMFNLEKNKIDILESLNSKIHGSLFSPISSTLSESVWSITCSILEKANSAHKLNLVQNQIWLLLHLTKFGDLNPHTIPNLFFSFIGKLSKREMQLLSHTIEKEFYFLLHEPSISKRFQVLLEQISKSSCPDLYSSSEFNKLQKTVQNVVRISELNSISAFGESKKEDILKNLVDADNIYSSPDRIFSRYLLQLFSELSETSLGPTLQLLLKLQTLNSLHYVFNRSFVEYMRVKKRSQSSLMLALLLGLSQYYPFLVHSTVEMFVQSSLELIFFSPNSNKQVKMDFTSDLVLLVDKKLVQEQVLFDILTLIKRPNPRNFVIWYQIQVSSKSQTALLSWTREISRDHFQNNFINELGKLPKQHLIRTIAELPEIQINTPQSLIKFMKDTQSLNDQSDSEIPIEQISKSANSSGQEDICTLFSLEQLFRHELITRILKHFDPQTNLSSTYINILFEHIFDMVNLKLNNKITAFLEFGAFDIMRNIMCRLGVNNLDALVTNNKIYRGRSRREMLNLIFGYYDVYFIERQRGRRGDQDVDIIYVSPKLLKWVDCLLKEKKADKKKQERKRDRLELQRELKNNSNNECNRDKNSNSKLDRPINDNIENNQHIGKQEMRDHQGNINETHLEGEEDEIGNDIQEMDFEMELNSFLRDEIGKTNNNSVKVDFKINSLKFGKGGPKQTQGISLMTRVDRKRVRGKHIFGFGESKHAKLFSE